MGILKYKRLGLAPVGIIAVCVVIIISLSFLLYPGRGGNMDKNTGVKIILIGLDGATWDIILPLVKQGKLANIERIMQQGSYGVLNSLRPMHSPMLWTSIATGKTQKKHAIGLEAYSYLQDATSIKTSTVWDILEKNNKKIGLFNWLVTWPPRKINGFIIPGWTAQDDRTYPEGIFSNTSLKIPVHELQSVHRAFKDLNELSTKLFYLKKRFDPDFFAIVFYGSDMLQHTYWSYMQPQPFKNVDKEGIKKYGNIIYRYYEDFDRVLGEILNSADKDTVIIIVSDHGFGPHMPNETSQVYFFNTECFLSDIGLQKNNESGSIDIAKSIAHSWKLLEKNNMHIIINVNAENDSHLVRGHDYNKVKDEVIKLIEGITIKESGKNLFRFIKEDGKEKLIFEIMSQNLSEQGHIQVGDGIFPLNRFILKGGYSGAHRIEGVVMLYGKNIIQGQKMKAASILDITPTILYLFGLPAGADMDGIVLTQAINQDYLKRHPVKNIASYDVLFRKKLSVPNSYINIDGKLIEKMKSLGYLQ